MRAITYHEHEGDDDTEDVYGLVQPGDAQVAPEHQPDSIRQGAALELFAFLVLSAWSLSAAAV